MNSIISISAHRKWQEMVVSCSTNQVWTKITIRSNAWLFAIQIQIKAVWREWRVASSRFIQPKCTYKNHWTKITWSMSIEKNYLMIKKEKNCDFYSNSISFYHYFLCKEGTYLCPNIECKNCMNFTFPIWLYPNLNLKTWWLTNG